MIWLCLAIGSFALGLALVALYTSIFSPMWVEAMRADLQKKLLDEAFGNGYKCHRDEMSRR